MSRFKKFAFGFGLATLVSMTLSVIYVPVIQAPLVSSLLVLGAKDHQLWAVKRLATLGDAGLSGLAFALEADDLEVQTQALNALYKLGPRAQPVAGALAALIDHDDRYIACAASASLSKLGEGAAPFQNELRSELDREYGPGIDGRFRRKELQELEKYRGPVRSCPKNELCIHKVRAIAEMGPAARESVATLTRVIQYSDDRKLVCHAAFALGMQGSSARLATMTLRHRLNQFDHKKEHAKHLRRLRVGDVLEPEFECVEVFLIYALWKIEGPKSIRWDILARLKKDRGDEGEYDVRWILKELEGQIPEDFETLKTTSSYGSS